MHPHVFGPPGSVSICQMHGSGFGSGSGSFPFLINVLRDPNQDPLVRGADPGIRIRTKMSRIPNTDQDTERDRPVLGDHEDGDEVDDGQGQELRLLRFLYISANVKSLCC